MKEIINGCTQTAQEVYEKFDASHDFSHIERVIKNAQAIAVTEPAAMQSTVHLAALLHDIDDVKYKSDENPTAQEILEINGASTEVIADVLACIESVSFSGGNEQEITSIEGAILRDADRLDAIGAIGIARTFAFGGAKGRRLYDRDEIVRSEMSEEEYRKRGTASLTHFYEKLLLLKDLMVTKEGKRLAKERHQFLVEFLRQINNEVGL